MNFNLHYTTSTNLHVKTCKNYEQHMTKKEREGQGGHLNNQKQTLAPDFLLNNTIFKKLFGIIALFKIYLFNNFFSELSQILIK